MYRKHLVLPNRAPSPSAKPPLLYLHECLWGTGDRTTGHLGRPAHITQNPLWSAGGLLTSSTRGFPRDTPWLPCHSPSCLCSVWNFESWTTDVWCSGREFTGWRPQALACPPGPAITWTPPIALASWPDVAPLRRDTLVVTSQTRGSAV